MMTKAEVIGNKNASVLAVNYHYYRDYAPSSGIYPITQKVFEKQLGLLAAEYKFISGRDLIEIIDGENKSENGNSCILTFDDGLKEQMRAAQQLLARGIPAIFYVSTHPIRNSCVSEVHKLHYIRSKICDAKIFQTLDLKFSISTFDFDQCVLDHQYRYDTDLSKKVKYFTNFVLAEDEKKYLVDYLFSEIVDNEKEFSSKLYMNKEDIKWLADRGMLGTHGDEHKPLATLSVLEIKRNIEESLEFFDLVVGKVDSINSISYPYGGPTAVSSDVARVAESCGMRFGFTMARGVNTTEDLSRPLLLKRVDTNDAPGGKASMRS